MPVRHSKVCPNKCSPAYSLTLWLCIKKITYTLFCAGERAMYPFMRRYGHIVGFSLRHYATLAMMDEYITDSGQKILKNFKVIFHAIIRESGINITTHFRCATIHQALRWLPPYSGLCVQECPNLNNPGRTRKLSKNAYVPLWTRLKAMLRNTKKAMLWKSFQRNAKRELSITPEATMYDFMDGALFIDVKN